MKVFHKYIDTLEISRSQHRLLRFLSHSDGNISQKDIAKQFDISTAAVAVTLKKLEEMGYIVRTTNQNDSRFNSVSITEKGRKVLDRTYREFLSIDTAMFKDVTEQELEVFTICLNKMQSSLKQMQEQSDN